MKRISRSTRIRERHARRSALAEAESRGSAEVAALSDRHVDAELPNLSRAKGQWVFGDWATLAALDIAAVSRHPERDRLALLVACAHQQRSHHELARDFVRQALAWGCDRQLAARLLVSGLHNTLGRIAALKADDSMIERHFRDAMAVTQDAESRAATHTRAVREMADLGLLPQAARLLHGEIQKTDNASERPIAQAARMEMLRSEVELIQHEISIAQQRHQVRLNVRLDGDEPGRPAQDRREALRQRSTSQLGQDLWVLERTGFKRGGFFVEFGATDGVRLSNSYLLEQEFDWHGLCAEPNPRMFAQLVQNRRCVCSDACIAGRSGQTVEFVLAEEYGGMVKDLDVDQHAAKRLAYLEDPANRVTLVSESLHDFLTRLGAPRDIDYISIDTEGSELEILQAFPFDRWNVRFMTIEHNFTARREDIRLLMESNGYRRTEAQWDDWFERLPSESSRP